MSQYDFSYNYDSLNDAFNAVNRKGKMQKRYLSPEYLDKAQEYREMRNELNEILRKKKAERTEEETSRIDYLKKQMNENAREQKNLLQEHLTKVSSYILSSSFHFNLTPDASEDPDKPVYSIGTTAEEFFAMQVLCRNVKKLFKISMSSRDEILSQLKMLLREDKSRYYVIRTDVCHCFESIPHDKLFEYLEGNNLLDVKSKSLLRGLIRKEFEAKNLRPRVKTPQTGIPRGCAISSLLSEFYLSKIDEKIKRKLQDVVFLGRYVDDMVLVIHPDIRDEYYKSLDWYIDELTKIYSQNGLKIHTPSEAKGKCYTYDSDKEEEYGHADGMVRFVSDNHVLINNYKDIDTELRLKVLDALSPYFSQISELEYGSAQRVNSWAHINYLQVNNLIFVPQLEIPSDKLAIEQISSIFPDSTIIPVEVKGIVKKGGALDCVSWNYFNN